MYTQTLYTIEWNILLFYFSHCCSSCSSRFLHRLLFVFSKVLIDCFRLSTNINERPKTGSWQLVITLFVANHFVRSILIDNGSSVNIIQLEALKMMNIPESEIASQSSTLIGFSGEVKKHSRRDQASSLHRRSKFYQKILCYWFTSLL